LSEESSETKSQNNPASNKQFATVLINQLFPPNLGYNSGQTQLSFSSKPADRHPAAGFPPTFFEGGIFFSHFFPS
jgi:hypothetical protein